MIKLIVFDLDGVLIDSCDTHFESLNLALDSLGLDEYKISYKTHLQTYNGKPTMEKLKILAREKNLPEKYFQSIWKAKQEKTKEIINNYTVDHRLVKILKQLKEDGYLLFCASNSIRSTLSTTLSRLGLLEYMDYIISSEDVVNPKPHPEIYLKCFEKANLLPTQCLIIEDSPIGKLSAYQSCGSVLEVNNPADITYNNIKTKILEIEFRIDSNLEMNVVIPMAGLGTRFSQAGYVSPKPLINVNGKPMIQLVVENLRISNCKQNFIFIVREEHIDAYNLIPFLHSIAPNCQIIPVHETTQGAACTVLLAQKYINNDIPLIIANSDQFLEWNPLHFLNYAKNKNLDALISTFTSSHPKWSYAKLDSSGKVTQVAEKNPISNYATTGIYYWKHGHNFITFANMMISKNIRVNNEFYVCPVFNQAIDNNKKIGVYPCDKMWGLGTPEDLEFFITNYLC